MWLLVLFLVASPFIIGLGIREVVRQRRLRREGVMVEGTVVRHNSKRDQGGYVHFAVVGFVDERGSPHEFQADASGVKGLPVGGRAPVRYIPGAPETARLDIFAQRVVSIVLPFVVGIAFMASGIWALAVDG